MVYEWTELTYMQKLEGNTAVFIFPLCMLFVFLTHSAEYESWSLPLGIILIVPMSLLCALFGIHLRHLDNDIFTQIGFIVLIGLACKNAVLIIEFATHEEKHKGLKPFDASLSASKLRLRPILMTSFAFILGVVPLMLSHGAGAEMRRTLGTCVFSGMLGVTIFGIFLTPVFYLVIRWVAGNKPLGQQHHPPEGTPTPEHVESPTVVPAHEWPCLITGYDRQIYMRSQAGENAKEDAKGNEIMRANIRGFPIFFASAFMPSRFAFVFALRGGVAHSRKVI